MIRKKFKKLNNYVYEEVLDNGLRIYICQMKRKNVFAEMTVLYGSKDICFKKKGSSEYIKTYPGTAHLLEHLMYLPDASFNPSKIYEENGASHNAYTNKSTTSYYFRGSTNFEDNLNTLLTCVTNLNVGENDVIKEREVIKQELLRYVDNPGYIAANRCIQNAIVKDNARYDNGGEIEDLYKINLDMIKTCFEYFYHPSNMFLVVCGDVDPEKVVNQVRNFYINKKYPKFTIIRKEEKEPLKVLKKNEVIHKDVSNKVICINYKIKKTEMDEFKLRVYLRALLELKFGPLSNIYDENLKNSNYITNIEYGIFYIKDYAFLNFQVTVQSNPEEFINLVDYVLKNGNLNEEYTEVYKKMMIKNLILDFENVSYVADIIEGDILKYNTIKYDIYDEIKALDVMDFKEFIKTLDFSNKSEVICEK